MVRFFLEKPFSDDEIVLDGEERHHLVDVYRSQPGMKVQLFDREGNEYLAEVLAVTAKNARLKVLEKSLSSKTKEHNIFLAQGLIKSQNWDVILEKCMELGLKGLFPMLTQHLGNGKYVAGKEERWNKVMVSSAKQCGRSSLIKIEPIMTFSDVIEKTSSFPTRLLAHTGEGLPSFKKALDSLVPILFPVLIMIGPEGGFSQKEIQQAYDHKILIFSLGNLILRAETAAIAVVANLNFYLQDTL
ncbi:MAG: 16S rRNA (uracil(1498)-N(3))-methyltransferase [Candidatus Brocadiae bacterium]|nr:16S rRNA (uracil(1498)-N(3))-methyltransferase [Candidatus Brocadiia bacterium]